MLKFTSFIRFYGQVRTIKDHKCPLTHPSLSKAVKHASISRNFESSTKVLRLMLVVCLIAAMSVPGDANCGHTFSTI